MARPTTPGFAPLPEPKRVMPEAKIEFLGEIEREMSIEGSDLGISGRWGIRDLWRQKDLGAFDRRYTAPVARHGVLMLRLCPAE